MKAQSIITIEKVLCQDLEKAQQHYFELIKIAKKKYNTEYLHNVLSDSEDEEINQALKSMQELREAYKEFCEHQW